MRSQILQLKMIYWARNVSVRSVVELYISMKILIKEYSYELLNKPSSTMILKHLSIFFLLRIISSS
jgi:hypothetical protein